MGECWNDDVDYSGGGCLSCKRVFCVDNEHLFYCSWCINILDPEEERYVLGYVFTAWGGLMRWNGEWDEDGMENGMKIREIG